MFSLARNVNAAHGKVMSTANATKARTRGNTSGRKPHEATDRDARVAVRFSEDETQMLDELARTSGLSKSDVVRQLVRRASAEQRAARAAPPQMLLGPAGPLVR